MKDDTAKQP